MMSVGWPLAMAGGVFIAFAACLRGLTGFGFAIVATPLLALVLPPTLAVPIVLFLQIPAGLQTGFSDWKNTDRRAAATACLAGAPAIIPGLFLVSSVAPETMRVVVGIVVVLSTLVLSFGFRLGRPAKTVELAAAGAMSGFLMGAVAMAGPPVIVLLLASSWPAARCRATLSFVFFLLGCASFALAAWYGLVTWESLLLGALYAPGLLGGQALGARLFARVDANRYRSISLATVASTGVLVVARGVADQF
jgi:uncharacterized membrane protein YfcA